MRVSRSLTIKQMATVATVATVFIFVFSVTLLFHIVAQNRYTTAMQMESVARSIRAPLSNAILRADITQAEVILHQIPPTGIISRADVVLPNQFQALRINFINERPLPQFIARVFELPLQITLPLYSLERPANPQPLAYLVLKADNDRMYRFIISTLSTLTTNWLLLSLVVTVALSWCINRLIVHPLRRIARELNNLKGDEIAFHQLSLPRLHQDDEIGLIVRAYNLNQRQLQRNNEALNTMATHFPISNLPNKSLFSALLAQHLGRGESGALVVINSATLHDAAGVLNDKQRDVLLMTLVNKIQNVISHDMIFGQMTPHVFAILARGLHEEWQVMLLAETLLARVNERVSIQGLQLLPVTHIGVAMPYSGAEAEPFYRRAIAASFAAQRPGNNQIQFFDPQQMERAHRRLTETHELQHGLEHGQFALWLQPQIDLSTGQIVAAEALLRQRQPDGSWALPDGLIAQIEACGQMVLFGNWILEESCRMLAEMQARGTTLNISVNLSALQMLQNNLSSVILGFLERYKIKPGSFILEITETYQIANAPGAIDVLRPLRDAGVLIALDDFGMGYSSLAQLHQMHSLPVDALKLDKLFVKGLPQESRIASTIIQLAQSLNLIVIAEGVETAEQREWLKAAGVQLAQGYLFAKAQSPEQLDILLKRQGAGNQ